MMLKMVPLVPDVQTLQHEAEEGAKQAERKDEASRLKKINANKKNWQKNHEAVEWRAAQEQAAPPDPGSSTVVEW